MGMNKLPFIFFLFFLKLSFAFPEDRPAVIRPELIEKDKTFSLEILWNSFVDEIEIIEPDLPEGLSVLSGPYIKPVFVKNKDGLVEKQTVIAYKLRGNRAGRFFVDPYMIKTGSGRISTDPFFIEIGEMKNGKIFVPIRAEWKINDGIFYKGKTFYAELWVINHTDKIPPGYQFLEPFSDISLEEVSDSPFLNNSGSMRILKNISGREYYSFPLAVFLITPLSTGEFRLPDLKVSGKEGGGRVGRYKFTPVPLPAGVEASTNGIGDLVFLSRIERKTAGDRRVVFYETVKGEGNLSFLSLPEPYYENLIKETVREENNFHPSTKGYKGEKSRIYVFKMLSGKDSIVEMPPVFWLQDGKIKSTPKKTYKIPAEPEAGKPPPKNKPPLRLLPFTEKKYTVWGRLYLNPFSYLFILPCPLILLLSVFIIKKRGGLLTGVFFGLVFLSAVLFFRNSGTILTETAHKKIVSGIHNYKNSEWNSAVQCFSSALAESPRLPEIITNLGLSYYQKGDRGKAVALIQKALIISPENNRIREKLSTIESRLGITGQVRVNHLPVNLEFLFIFLLFLLYLLTAAVSVFLQTKNAGTRVLLILSAAVFLIVSGGFVSLIVCRNAPHFVVLSRDAGLQKIPEKTDLPGKIIPAGTTLLIAGDRTHNGLIQIKTGLNEYGWISKSSVIYLSDLDILSARGK